MGRIGTSKTARIALVLQVLRYNCCNNDGRMGGGGLFFSLGPHTASFACLYTMNTSHVCTSLRDVCFVQRLGGGGRASLYARQLCTPQKPPTRESRSSDRETMQKTKTERVPEQRGERGGSQERDLLAVFHRTGANEIGSPHKEGEGEKESSAGRVCTKMSP